VERFTTSDGISIAVHRWPVESAQPPVVLQHGFAASSAINWEAPGIVAALTASGRSVVAVDARGHGQSDKPHDPARYGEMRMARDLVELFDDRGWEQVDLVGYSMGAIVSILAATLDHRIRRLGVGGVGGGVAELGGVDRRTLGAVAAGLRAADSASLTNPTVRQFRRFAELMGNDLHALAAQAEAVHASPIAFDQITADALVVVGASDELAGHPEVLADALHARLVVVPGDHLSAVATPEFTVALLDFLNPDDGAVP